jgi:hypothetical protein
MKRELTAEQLRTALDYEPDIGTFRWRETYTNSVKVGDVAGSLHSKGYVHIWIRNAPHYAHRLAWLYVYGEWPTGMLDHINGDKADNRISNLRLATPTLNQQNMRKASKLSGTGLLGAQVCRFTGLYRARIRVDGRSVEIGRFRTAIEAHEAYVATKRRLHEGCTI